MLCCRVNSARGASLLALRQRNPATLKLCYYTSTFPVVLVMLVQRSASPACKHVLGVAVLHISARDYCTSIVVDVIADFLSLLSSCDCGHNNSLDEMLSSPFPASKAAFAWLVFKWLTCEGGSCVVTVGSAMRLRIATRR